MKEKDCKVVPGTYIEKLAVFKYGNDINTFGCQRDGFIEGYKTAQAKYEEKIAQLNKELIGYKNNYTEINSLVNDIETILTGKPAPEEKNPKELYCWEFETNQRRCKQQCNACKNQLKD